MSSMLDNPRVRESALRLNIDQYHRLCESGIISERTELLAGIVVSKMGKSPLHTWTVEFLADWLRQRLPTRQTLRVEQPLTLTDSEPEPDLAVVSGVRDDYRTAHPTTASLVIEVAVSTEDIDRMKSAIYALADVAEYWIVLPQQQQIVIQSNPLGTPKQFSRTTVCRRSDSLHWAASTMTCRDLFPE